MTILMIEDDSALYAVTKNLLEVIRAGTFFDGLREVSVSWLR
jgi:hypothetical protein